MATLPSVLKNYVAYLDGIGYAGKVPDAKLPGIKLKTDDYDAGGLGGSVAIDMGTMEKMESELTFAEYSNAVLGLFGNSNTVLTLRGAQEGDTGTAEPVIIAMRGLFSQIDPGSWKKGSQTANKCTVELRYLKITIGTAVVVEIDIENMKRIINGTDQMAAIRRALGI